MEGEGGLALQFTNADDQGFFAMILLLISHDNKRLVSVSGTNK